MSEEQKPGISPELMKRWLNGDLAEPVNKPQELDPFEGVIDSPPADEMVMRELSRATAGKAGFDAVPPDGIFDEHFARGGWLPVVDWEVRDVPDRVFAFWRTCLMLSGVLATGQIYMTDDGCAGGVTQPGLFRHAMSHLSGAIAAKGWKECIVVETKANFIGPEGIMRENAMSGLSYIAGRTGCEPVRVKSGENPLEAMRRAIGKACGGFMARIINCRDERSAREKRKEAEDLAYWKTAMANAYVAHRHGEAKKRVFQWERGGIRATITIENVSGGKK